MQLGGHPSILSFDPYTQELPQYNAVGVSQATAETHHLGERVDLSDSRVFRYTLAGASNISKGKLQTAPTPKTNHHNMAVQAAAAIGTTTVSVTLGATATVAQEYAEGFLMISVTPGQGQVLKISSQPLTASAGTQTLTLFDPVQVALTTSSKANLVHNKFSNVIEGTSQTTRAAGVPMLSVTAGNYFWAQTKGEATVLADQTIALGASIVPSTSVAGSVIAISGTWSTALATNVVGAATIMAGVDTEYRPMVLAID